ncbi:MAG: hypothetical protein JO353_10880 [Phycisphaerae bacterium]|nr:hypothetical protein [Phycisphaerae bacterium]
MNTGVAETRWGWRTAVALILLLVGSKAILFDTLDPDSFWHLRVADQLLHDGIGPIVDHLAFTSSKLPWTPYSWLAELGMRGLWNLGGFRAAVAAQAITIASIYAFIAVTCLVRGASRFAVLITLIAGAYLSLPYLSFRPATFALALFALGVWLLVRDRARGERSRAVWMIVPLTALTVNIHLFAFLLPASVAALLAGAIIERRSIRRYAILFALCSAACLATPMLRGMLATMWFYQTNDAMVAGPTIAELKPFYVGPIGWLSLLLVLCGLFACWRNRSMLRAGEWFWLIGAVALLFRMGRFTPLFVIIASPIIAFTLPTMEGWVLEKPKIRWALAIVLVGGMCKIVTGFPSKTMPIDSWLNRMGPGTPGYPCGAAEYVESNVPHRTGHVLNEFTWGGYLAWRLGPAYQTFMDGRTQVFSGTFWQKTCMADADNYRRYLATVPADSAIVPVNHAPLRDAIIALGWRKAFADDRAEVYVPPMAAASAN